ncbi:PepSY-associated TM helix domain-containing protein [Pseudoalteromonas sp. S16_S37]|uniref:PepSY-associated TM helix domain-containing protein n=1 Tax=Pseudoalteromonas sp. S16_S37 TaxID=2720228 RepID=UPI0016816CCC|nr:PepSY-associated TM helix domain-containing protein [Pseudoalteromonas sp. S16_S37]MBD1584291.1 PepSY domain-containing protein [Pseudoalteromonas sp. S16_S37]
MRSGFRQSMAWLHTWTGIVVSWILYFIFVTGTLGYFDSEIDAWMKPELPRNTASVQTALHSAQQHLTLYGQDAKDWRIYLPISRTEPHLFLGYQQKNAEGKLVRTSLQIDAATGEVLKSRATGGGQTLYRMHYRLHYIPTKLAYYFVGVFTLFMLLGLITGIMVHKKIFKEFFTFRVNKGATSWLDGHNLMSVMSLPFHLMITYSGLVMFTFTYVPFVFNASYGFGDEGKKQFFDEYYKNSAPTEALGKTATMLPLTELYHNASVYLERQGNEQANYAIRIYHPNDVNSVAVFSPELSDASNDGSKLVMSAISGEVLSYQPHYSGVRRVHSVLLELHEGIFANLPIRWLYFLSGLTGCVMIASGMVLWTKKRRTKALNNPQGVPFSFKLTEGLNIGTIVGLPAAVAVYFLANRLLPLGLDARAQWEVHCFFITWLMFLVHGMRLTWQSKSQIAWYQQWLCASVLFLLVPVINGITTSRGLVASTLNADWVYVAFDLTNLSAALVCLFIANKVKGAAEQMPRAQPDKFNSEVTT